MSYCGFGEDSNVYLYRDVLGCWICCSCRLAPEVMEGIHFHKSVALVSLEEVKAHLEAHQEAGHLVPDYAFERIEREAKVEMFRRKRRRMMHSSFWTKEWPTERGWYWFYGQTSKIVWDMEPEYIPVRVFKDATSKPIYVGSGQFLWEGEGARGLWTPLVMPTPPTDYQIEDVLA